MYQVMCVYIERGIGIKSKGPMHVLKQVGPSLEIAKETRECDNQGDRLTRETDLRSDKWCCDAEPNAEPNPTYRSLLTSFMNVS